MYDIQTLNDKPTFLFQSILFGQPNLAAMSDPSSAVPATLKAADLVKSFVTEIASNVHFIFAFFCGVFFLAVVPPCYIPSNIYNLRWLFIALSIFSLVYWLSLWWFSHKPTRRKLWYLEFIGADEREILIDYLKEDRTCRYFYALHGPVLSLIGKGILQYAGTQVPVFNAPVMIDTYVMRHLRKHPEILKLTKKDIGGSPLSKKPEPYDHVTQ
jgi:hypothetical protein